MWRLLSQQRGSAWLLLLPLIAVFLQRTTAATATFPLRGSSNTDDRYSRQVYTLGARAHGIVRSSTTIVLDSPSASSGLLYETAKNLALLGVARIVLWESSTTTTEEEDTNNNNEQDTLDDLGHAYQRMARAELGDSNMNGYRLLQAYLQRLNPQVQVTVCARGSTPRKEETDDDNDVLVYMAIDQPSTDTTTTTTDDYSRTVRVETAGVFGRIQCDFGDDHVVYDASGEPPVAIPLDRFEQHNNNSNTGDSDSSHEATVHCVPGEQHDVSVGDGVEFQLRNGTVVATECTVTAVETPARFRLRPTTTAFVHDMNEHAAIVRRRQIPQRLAFTRLDQVDVENDALFAPCDFSKSFDRVRRRASMACWEALATFRRHHQGRAPQTREDRASFRKLLSKGDDDDNDASLVLIQRFLQTCAAKLAPLQAVMGAIAAQEAIKAATGLYTPITQVLLYDCDELLSEEHDDEDTTTKNDDESKPAPGLRYILGDATVDELQKQQVFVVGAGAIGCELLKDLAPMGIHKIRVTDMDTIEPSNLSRQLLFRDADVGKFKSLAAKEAAYRLNPDMTVEAYSSKVGGGDDNPFDEEFWSKRVDVVLNALDNMEARLFIDSQCVANCKPLVDAGTMGPKGNVQVVIPKVSESYASSADPPEPSIPVCTLKNFPYAIAHTIQWGRDLFDGLYRRRPNQANSMVQKLKIEQDTRIVASNLIQEKGLDQSLETVEELAEDILAASDMAATRVRMEALVWAARLADELFHQSSIRLLQEHPIDSTDDEEEPFWSGTRRPPKLIQFNGQPGSEEEKSMDQNLVQFVRYAAQLRVESILSSDDESSNFSDKDARAALEACQTYPSNRDDKSKSKVLQVLSKCAEIQTSSTMIEVEFEKDDDMHASFCTAASNLRAIAYGIPPVDMAETRRVAGRIIPAMITTTALVSGLSCIELIKLVQNRPTPQHRNSFLNLALNFYAFTAPLPAPERPGFRGQSYTLWDRWELQESTKAAARGGVRMKSLCRRLQKLTAPDDPDSVDVLSISLGPFMVYSNFMHESDEDVMLSSLWERLEEATMDDDDDDDGREDVATGDDAVDISGPYIDLEVLVEDTESGEAIELPVVRVKRSKHNT